MSLGIKEKQVKELIGQNQTDDAIQLLFEMIVENAKKKQFIKAEKFRRQIIDLNSMALNEIINSAEIIESEKAKAIDLDHKKRWMPLYNKLSDEETNDLYYSLKKINLMPGKMIMQESRINNRLFLIDSGILKVIHEHDRAEVFLKEVGKGEPVGIKSFFTISCATTTVITIGPVSLHYLDRETFTRLIEKHPRIDVKLENLCSILVKKKVEDLIKDKSMERRRHKRFSASGKVAVYFLNTKGEPNKIPIYGMLEDISEGGCRFSIRQAIKETARLFLGRQALLNIESVKGGKKIAKNGRVTSVYSQHLEYYSINFMFKKPLPQKNMKLSTLKD